MASRVGICAALAAAVGVAGCAAAPPPRAAAPDQPASQARGLKVYRGKLCRCPEPVHYSDAEIKAITAALRALPDNNPLQQAMSDYEDERDNLRICLGR